MEYGTIKIKLDELLKNRGISKRKIGRMAEMNWSQVDKYCKGEITRFDADVLVRMCMALDCKLSDLLEYVPYVPPPKE